jgi:hypothetical protein
MSDILGVKIRMLRLHGMELCCGILKAYGDMGLSGIQYTVFLSRNLLWAPGRYVKSRGLILDDSLSRTIYDPLRPQAQILPAHPSQP